LLSHGGASESEELHNHEYNKKLVNYLFPENVNATEGQSISGEGGLNDSHTQTLSPTKGMQRFSITT